MLSGTLARIALTLLPSLIAYGASARPVISLHPKEGPESSSLYVLGEGFTADGTARLTLDWDKDRPDDVVVRASGRFKFTTIVPVATPPLLYFVHAKDEATGRTAVAKSFRVTSPWSQFDFLASGGRFNPWENVVGPANVSTLGGLYSKDVADRLLASPIEEVSDPEASGYLYIVRDKLYAFDVETGDLKWSADIGNDGAGYSTPAVIDGKVVVGTLDGNLLFFDAKTGAPPPAAARAPQALAGPIDSPPTVDRNVVYVGSQDGKLYAVSAKTGVLLWSAPTGGMIDVAAPALGKNIVYIGSFDHNLYAFNVSDGTPAWSSPAATGGALSSSPAVSKGIVYVGSFDKKLYAFSATSGAQVWATVTGGPIGGGVALDPGTNRVYAGAGDGNLYAFNAKTGKVLWTGATGGVIFFSSPALANGVVYIGSTDGKLYAFDASGCGAKTCAPLWSSPATGGAITSSPSVSDGRVLVGSQDGSLYAYGLPATRMGIGRYIGKGPRNACTLVAAWSLGAIPEMIGM